LAGVGVIAALVAMAIGHRRAASGAEAETVAGEVDALVRETAASVAARAETLAQLPRLGWIVATDAATVGDLTADELEFRAHPGEEIQLGQIRISDQKVHVLRRFPAGSTLALPITRSGSGVLVAGGKVYAVTVAGVHPWERAKEIRGAVAVAKAVDAGPLARRLAALGVDVAVQASSGVAALGARLPAKGSGATTAPLASAKSDGAVVIVSGPKATASGGGWARVLPWLLLILSFGGAAVLWRRGSPAAAQVGNGIPTVFAGAVNVEGSDEEEGELTFDPDATVLAVPGAAPAAARITRSRTGSVPILASGPRAGMPRTRTPPGVPTQEVDSLTAEYRALFAEYLNLRRTCGEPIIDFDREDFISTLRDTRERLIREDSVQDVRFSLAFANGKAVIRFTTIV
jgi:hypothetical protein